jgi:hypothetical protein
VFALWVLPWVAGAVQAQSTHAGDQDHTAAPQALLPDYSQGARTFPDILNPYRPTPVQALHLENSPRLHDLIHDERLRLSLSDALSIRSARSTCSARAPARRHAACLARGSRAA